MCFRVIQLFLIALLMPTYLLSQNVGHNPSKFLGVWRGEFDNLPGVEIVITDEGGTTHGAILFYLHQRANVNSPYISTAGLPEPMLNLNLKEDTLFFEVSHRRAHPPRTLHDAPVKFHLKLIGPNQAELMNENEGAPILQMKRNDY